MARIKRKGEAGAAKAYVTRSAAVKKLQCSLADFRRLCILKGIYPREPRHRKKANKGSSAPTSFYYAKDIIYLAHEPVLKKLREHKAFAKRFARALGRAEWSSAKSLEDNKPVYQIDHIVKERYPSFVDAVRDLDDALCMIFLFASLPSSPRVPPSLIENCASLAAQWQLYIMKAKALRKVFLSIKGVYFQAEVMGENVTWLVPYMFTQNIPTDVDVRVMLTFLELYQTLLGFVLFKLYMDIGFIYPPPLDIQRDQDAAGLGAFTLRESTSSGGGFVSNETDMDLTGVKRVSGKDMKATIKSINAEAVSSPSVNDTTILESAAEHDEEEFVVHDSTITGPDSSSRLPTLATITNMTSTVTHSLFAPFVFFLSRETPRSLFEFMIRSFGGKVGWHDSQGAGSPVQGDDETITHVIIDRPSQVPQTESENERLVRLRRKYVQPQWLVDCINAGSILLEDSYGQGKILPPHLSPFGEEDGAYTSPVTDGQETQRGPVNPDEGSGSQTSSDGGHNGTETDLEGAATAELECTQTNEIDAELAGVDAQAFESRARKVAFKVSKSDTAAMTAAREETEMRKMLLSNKKRKLYEKLKYTENKRANEKAVLEKKRKALEKQIKRISDP